MTKKEQTATLPYGMLNPPVVPNFKLKMDLNQDDFLRLTVINTQESLFGIKGLNPNSTIWKAVVMRVDAFEDGTVWVKARIPEKDATIPEPVEWVAPDCESCSHFTIDLHRTYIGEVKTAPKIGQIISVTIPADNKLSQPGTIVQVEDEYVNFGIKSTKIESGAQAAADAPQSAPALPSTSGDAIGSGQKNPASQVASEVSAATPPSAQAPAPQAVTGVDGSGVDLNPGTQAKMEAAGGYAKTSFNYSTNQWETVRICERNTLGQETPC